MQIWEQAQPLDGWNMTKDGIPEPGAEVEILHFGNWPESQIFDTATVDQWGICPHTSSNELNSGAAEGGCSRSA